MNHGLRTYTNLPEATPKFLKRFETKALSIWKKYGIQPIGFWTTVIGFSSNELIYLFARDSLAEREGKWTAFSSDPKWLEARDESEAGGAFVANIASQILKAPDFSNL